MGLCFRVHETRCRVASCVDRKLRLPEGFHFSSRGVQRQNSREVGGCETVEV